MTHNKSVIHSAACWQLGPHSSACWQLGTHSSGHRLYHPVAYPGCLLWDPDNPVPVTHDGDLAYNGRGEGEIPLSITSNKSVIHSAAGWQRGPHSSGHRLYHPVAYPGCLLWDPDNPVPVTHDGDLAYNGRGEGDIPLSMTYNKSVIHSVACWQLGPHSSGHRLHHPVPYPGCLLWDPMTEVTQTTRSL
ncbi:hypothetical protein J6590_049672 [Homalodisca vitripennis]|nr:hypothetical protein J6590_049672 [Homalodisca vitripennis]